MPKIYTRIAMSKPIGKVLDSKVGKGMVKVGKFLTTFPNQGKLNKAKDAIYRANAPVGAIGGTNTGAYKPVPATKLGTPPMRTTKPSASMIKKMGFKK